MTLFTCDALRSQRELKYRLSDDGERAIDMVIVPEGVTC